MRTVSKASKCVNVLKFSQFCDKSKSNGIPLSIENIFCHKISENVHSLISRKINETILLDDNKSYRQIINDWFQNYGWHLNVKNPLSSLIYSHKCSREE